MWSMTRVPTGGFVVQTTLQRSGNVKFNIVLTYPPPLTISVYHLFHFFSFPLPSSSLLYTFSPSFSSLSPLLPIFFSLHTLSSSRYLSLTFPPPLIPTSSTSSHPHLSPSPLLPNLPILLSTTPPFLLPTPQCQVLTVLMRLPRGPVRSII